MLLPIANKDYVEASGYNAWLDKTEDDPKKKEQPPDALKAVLLPYVPGITSGT